MRVQFYERNTLIRDLKLEVGGIGAAFMWKMLLVSPVAIKKGIQICGAKIYRTGLKRLMFLPTVDRPLTDCHVYRKT